MPVLSVLFLSKAIKSDGLAEMLYQGCDAKNRGKKLSQKVQKSNSF